MTAAAELTTPLPGDLPDVIKDLYLEVIEGAIAAHPRSQQKRIGPSEIGIPCDRCLGHKLHGTPEAERGPAWKPAVGTAVHAQLEEWFTKASADDPEQASAWECETRVNVGEIDGTEITGSCDLYFTYSGMVIDHKVVGPKMLTKYRTNGPSQQYRVQAHLYARGFLRAGRMARHVAIAFLPRDGELKLAHFWHEPFDEQIAIDALARANRIAVNVRAMSALGEDAVLNYINHLPVDPDCFSCSRFPGAPTKPVAKDTAALINL